MQFAQIWMGFTVLRASIGMAHAVCPRCGHCVAWQRHNPTHAARTKRARRPPAGHLGVERCASWVGRKLKRLHLTRQWALMCRAHAQHPASHLRCYGGRGQGEPRPHVALRMQNSLVGGILHQSRSSNPPFTDSGFMSEVALGANDHRAGQVFKVSATCSKRFTVRWSGFPRWDRFRTPTRRR